MTFKITINQFSLADKGILAEKWQSLEKKSNYNVFLSWLWIGHWLDLVTDKLFLIEAYRDDEVVGLGFFVEKKRYALGFYPIKQWWLHRTGHQHQDQIWIEYNDFLLNSSIADEVRKEMIEQVKIYSPSVKEYIIGLSSSSVLNEFSQNFSYQKNDIKTTGYLVDLTKIEKPFLTEVVSKNTRSQINRSKKLLCEQGGLSYQVVSEKDELLKLLPNIAKIHIDLWQNTLEGSGFDNAIFKKFHTQLIKHMINQEVQISILSLNDEILGYLMNFVINNKVYFYLSAINKNKDNRIKTGLILHSEAIQHYLDQGMSSYDFLGGEARYKQSLSNRRYSLAINSFFNNNLILQLEKKLKSIKLTFKLILAK
ncbi:MAG: hypothetical protein COB35_10915 [Gammaproteobacteria bacterium]|nr:MAG: hypothetical protein COB35_10915 [Gammaproteobacteria bacterium]